TAAEIAVANANGSVDITADEDAADTMTITGANVAGDFSVTGKAEVSLEGALVTANSINVQADDNIALDGALLSATAGSVEITAVTATVNEEAKVFATDNAVFNAAVSGDGTFDVNADVVHFDDTVSVTALDVTALSQAQFVSTVETTSKDLFVSADQIFFHGDVNAAGTLKAVADQMAFDGENMAAGTAIDIAGVRETVVSAGTTTLTAPTLYLNNIRNKAAIDEKPVDEEGTAGENNNTSDESIVDLIIDGNAVLNGDIHAQSITLNGNVTLNTDVALIAVTGEGEGKVFGDVTIGGEDGSNYIVGSHDLTINADNINVYGLVEVDNFNASAQGGFNYAGSTITTLGDLTVKADGDITFDNADGSGNAITAYGDIDITGATATFAGNVNAGKDLTIITDGDLSLQSEFTAGRDIFMSGASVTNGPAVLTAGGDITINATDGDIVFTGVVMDVMSSGSQLTAGTSRYIMTATGDITIDNAITTDIVDSKFEANNVNLSTGNAIISSVIAAENNVVVDVKENYIDGLSVDAQEGAVDVTATGYIVNTNILSEETATVKSEFGGIMNLNVIAGDIDVSANENITASNLTAFNSVKVVSENGELDGLTVVATGEDFANGGLAIDASGTWIVGGEYIAENGDISLTATEGTIKDATAVAKNGNVDIDIEGDQELDGMTITAVGDIDIEAYGFTGGVYVSEQGDVTLTATGEDISGVYAKAKQGNVTLTTEDGEALDIIGSTADAYLEAKIFSSGSVVNSAAISANDEATIISANYVIDSTADAAELATILSQGNVVSSKVVGATASVYTTEGNI
ncbi:MAG: hypothetical protein II381_01950, partial [Victivallales bacterium]|nr:hypothetical protein [Victivallales bacterium]